jgi:hypothetical protein
MSDKRFFLSWLYSSLAMYSLFYCWHGLLLNDFAALDFPKNAFLLVSLLIYLVIGLGMVFVFSSTKLERWKNNLPLKGLIIGAIIGVILYLFSLVIGISFSKNMSIKYILFDLTWQLIEQGIGGAVIGLCYTYLRKESFSKRT